MLLVMVAAAAAHGVGFGSGAVSVNPDDPNEIWVVVTDWGVTHTTDGGDTWEWICEESVGTTAVYGVLAMGPGEAIVATREGVRVLDDTCGSSAYAGLPADTFVPAVAPADLGFYALAITEDEGGIYRCDFSICSPTELVGPGIFPKTLRVDGDRAWASIVYEDTLAAELWRSDHDGGPWTLVHEWPDGDADPRILHVDGDDLWVWRRTRSPDETPNLLISHDAGVTFTSVFETGYYTDAAPSLLVLDGVMLLGSDAGARTWRSTDRGETWTEVSADVPSVRCAETVNGVGYTCAEHLQDGFDLATTTDGGTWVPIACLEEAVPPDCAADTCSSLSGAYQSAAAYGGGQCDTIITPPVPEDEEPPPCGCGGGSAGIIGVVAAFGRRRRRQ